MANRIDEIAKLIPRNSVVADIGTDHAYLIINLLLTKKIRYAYATDNKVGPLKNAKNNINKYQVDKQCELIKADGLDFALPKKVNTLVFAGLGGMTVIDILQKDEKKLLYIKYIVTDIHRDDDKVRLYLNKMSYKIDRSIDIIDKKKNYHLVRYVKQ